MKVHGNEFKVMIAGDTHANLKHVKNTLIRRAANEGIPRILQVGDFGFVWTNRSGDLNGELDVLSGILVKNEINLYFIEGNHEDYDLLESLGAKPDNDSMLEIVPNIWHIPRGFAWDWDGVRFLGIGGAVSVDRGPLNPDPRRDAYWWPQENITQRQAARACDVGKVDIVVSHDGPEFDGGFLATSLAPLAEKIDRASRSNRHAITAVVQATNPSALFHGHYHYRYNDKLNDTNIFGLDRDTTGTRSFVVLDLEKFKDGSWLA